jgi:hypothetical protein
MKKRQILILIAMLFVSTISFADSYRVIIGINGLRKAGDFAKATSNLSFPTKDEYKAPSGSIFKQIEDNPVAIEGGQYYLVEFNKVTTSGDGFVVVGEKYWMPAEKNQSYYRRLKNGVDIGALTLPFKLRFSPSQISPNASIGPYCGYKTALGYNWYASFLGTLGLAGISLNDVNAKDVENVIGLTYGAGCIFNYKGKFQLGLVIGSDLIGGDKGKNWTYENKPWLSLAAGFTFLK